MSLQTIIALSCMTAVAACTAAIVTVDSLFNLLGEGLL